MQYKRYARKRKWLAIAGIVVAVFGIGFFVRHDRVRSAQAADDLWYQALASNLTETGVTCTADDSQNGGSFHQAVDLKLKTKTDLHSALTTTSNGQKVSIEEIDTNTATYVRYTNITTTKRDTDGKAPDLSGLINVWSTSDNAGQTPLFGRTALGNCIVPLVHLSQSQADKYVAELRQNKIFQTDTGDSKKSKIDGTTVREYAVTIAPIPYITLMKSIANDYGSNALSGVDSSSYANRGTQKVTIAVSESSRRIVQIDFTSSKRSLTFSNYGKYPSVTVPTDTITADELQQRFEAVGNQ